MAEVPEGGVQVEGFGKRSAPRPARKSVLEEIYAELDELDRADDEQAAQWKAEVGGKVLDIAKQGMSTVGRGRFEITHQSTIGSIADLGLDLLSKYHAIKSEGPAIVRGISKLFGHIH